MALGLLGGIILCTRLGFGNPGGAYKADFAVVWTIPFSGPSAAQIVYQICSSRTQIPAKYPEFFEHLSNMTI